jgi:hypothetical protein
MTCVHADSASRTLNSLQLHIRLWILVLQYVGTVIGFFEALN